MANKPVYLMNDADNTPFLETYQLQTRTVKLMNRTLLANNWNTLCLPFDLSADDGDRYLCGRYYDGSR